MKLVFKQRFFSWLDSYNVYRVPDAAEAYSLDLESAEIAYTVEGQLSWGHRFEVSDASGRVVAELAQELFTFLPRFIISIGGEEVGTVQKEFSLFTPVYTLEMRGWTVEGDLFGWDYRITDSRGEVASVTKELFNFTDTYVIDVKDSKDELHALLAVLAIDAANCGK